MREQQTRVADKMSNKRAWKLHEFPAHSANVNAASLGHKSGRVLVTGGGDKKVNLWAIGKPNCIMSLSGHSTPVSCVRFSITEEHVCAGSQAGALKIWDLESAKMMRTLTGHRSSIKCVDFHPYGDFLASGSSDSGIKMWDIRKKGCIFGYKGHNSTVNSLRFSPDGQWIASGGDDNFVKVWDIRVGKVLSQFSDHVDSVSSVEFHPHEFLLASGSADRTVKFWDLETFSLVSSSNSDSAFVKCISFHPDGSCLFAASSETLRVHGWEPSGVLNSISTSWGKIQDIAISQQQLVGVASNLTNVSIFVVDLRQLKPGNISDGTRTVSSAGHPRRNFNTERSPEFVKSLNAMIANDESESDKESDDDLHIPPTTLFNSREVFNPRKDLSRTPPPDDEFRLNQPDERYTGLPRISRPTSPQDKQLKRLTKFKYVTVRPECGQPVGEESQDWSPRRSSVPAFSTSSNVLGTSFKNLQTQVPDHNSSRQSSLSDESSGPISARSADETKSPAEVSNFREWTYSIKHSPSEPILQGRPEEINLLHPHPIPPLQNVPRSAERPLAQCQPMLKATNYDSGPMDSFTRGQSANNSQDEYVPIPLNRPMGLSIEDFLPRNAQISYHNGAQVLDMDEASIFQSLSREHQSILAVLLARHRNLRIVYNIWQSKDVKTALETAVDLHDPTVVVDLLCVLVLKPTIWNLDLCVVVLPSIFQLLQSRYEGHMLTGCNSLRLILKNFAKVIKTNIESPIQTVGVDISREERYNKSMECYRHLVEIRAFTLKRQTVQGKIGHSFRELHSLLSSLA